MIFPKRSFQDFRKDLSSSCKDFCRSSVILQRSLWIFKGFFQDLYKINQGSLKIFSGFLTRACIVKIARIFKTYLAKLASFLRSNFLFTESTPRSLLLTFVLICFCCLWPIPWSPTIVYFMAPVTVVTTLRLTDIPATATVGAMMMMSILTIMWMWCSRWRWWCWCRISLFTWVSCWIQRWRRWRSRPIFIVMMVVMIIVIAVGSIRVAVRWATTTSSSLVVGSRPMIKTFWYVMVMIRWFWPMMTVFIPPWWITAMSRARWVRSSWKENYIIILFI